MSNLLYATDQYICDFEAEVEGIDKDCVILDRTAFFPGGGGQDCDLGTIDDIPVLEVRIKGDTVYHRVKEQSFKAGQRVSCKIDWERRYDLMKGHTGEHILFSSLRRESPGIEIVKIQISPTKKSFIVKGTIEWSQIARAQSLANDIVMRGLHVTECWLNRNDVEASGIRAKLDRIADERIRVVKIGEFDAAACAGLHVRNTAEIGMIFITKVVSAKPVGDLEIFFEIGRKAIKSSAELGLVALQASEIAGAQTENLISAIMNTKHDLFATKESLKKCLRWRLMSLKPEHYGSYKIFSDVIEGGDRRILIEESSRFIEDDDSIVILASKNDRIFVILAAGKNVKIDCSQILNNCISRFGGKGGGQKNFASGGVSGSENSEEIVYELVASVKSNLRMIDV